MLCCQATPCPAHATLSALPTFPFACHPLVCSGCGSYWLWTGGSCCLLPAMLCHCCGHGGLCVSFLAVCHCRHTESALYLLSYFVAGLGAMGFLIVHMCVCIPGRVGSSCTNVVWTTHPRTLSKSLPAYANNITHIDIKFLLLIYRFLNRAFHGLDCIRMIGIPSV